MRGKKDQLTELLGEAIAFAVKQKVGPNLIPPVSIAAENIDTGISYDRYLHHVTNSSH